MPELQFNGKKISFVEGENLIEAAKRVGHEIPHYCYHPGMTIVAQCRMCLVEIEGQRKLNTACSTICKEGMVVSTKSENVKKGVAGVQEFLLINHPLDCPICDQSGECSLQEYSLKHGAADTRNDFHRRTYLDVDMGPSIKKNMNRCIHCTRCIRYCDEIGDIYEMVAMERGAVTEIVTMDGNPLQTAYAGGLADICPVGSLTTKDFRFSKRVWYLKRNESICDGCAKGCNITVSSEKGIVFRLEPKENPKVNKWWMCDEGRYGFHFIHSPSRVLYPTVVSSSENITWEDALTQFQQHVRTSSEVGVLICADATLEEVQIAQKALPKASFFSYSPTVDGSGQDEALDHLLRRKDKSPNIKGMEKLGLESFAKFQPKDYDLCIFITGGKVRPPYGLAELAKKAIGVGVLMKEELLGYTLVLPGLSSLEKSGTYINHDSIEQEFKAAIPSLGFARPLDYILETTEGLS